MTTWDWFALPYPRVCHSLVYSSIIDNFCALGFVVSVPLKQSRRNDLMSQAEIAFEWDILYGDFFDRVCARMDLNLEEAILGYKFDADAKRTIIHLPQNGSDVFNLMLDKIKSCIAGAQTRAVVLEIHDLVCSILFNGWTAYQFAHRQPNRLR